MIAAPTLTRAEWRDVLTDKREWLLRRVFVTPSPLAYWARVVQLAAEDHLSDVDTDDTGNGRNLRAALEELLTADGLRLDSLTVDGSEVFAVVSLVKHEPPAVEPAPVAAPAQEAPPEIAPPTAEAAPAQLGGETPINTSMAVIAASETYTSYKVTAPGYSSTFSTKARGEADFEKKSKELARTGDRFKVTLQGKESAGKWEVIESRIQNEK